MTEIDSLKEKLSKLYLKAMAEHLDSVLREAQEKNRILSLLDLGFVHEHMDVVLIGNPGTGKTFLAKGIATAACNANIKVLFTSVMEMIMIWLLSEENLTGKT